MNNLSHIIRTFNRFELKYLVTLQQAEAFKSSLRHFLTPDEHGAGNGRYHLASLYYDSPDYRCYWEKEYGVRVRRKLRLRLYEIGEMLTDETPVFVEIKQRIGRVTQKRRTILTYGDALRLCNDRQIPERIPMARHDDQQDDWKDDRQVIEEIYAFLWQYNLYPASIVRYERQAFIGGVFDPGLRVTFDTKITSQTDRLLLHDEPWGLPVFPPQVVVMEIKVNERIPYWLTDLIAVHNLSLTSVSKYFHSINLAQNKSLAHRRLAVQDWSSTLYASYPRFFQSQEQAVKVERQRNFMNGD